MSRALLVLAGQRERARALDWVRRAPVNTRVTFQGPKRTLDQNAKLWAMLTEVAMQTTWHGQRLTADDWKTLFLAALKSEMRMVPNINGDGWVQLGRSSSDLSREEFSDLIEIIHMFGARAGVEFYGDRDPEAVKSPSGVAA